MTSLTKFFLLSFLGILSGACSQLNLPTAKLTFSTQPASTLTNGIITPVKVRVLNNDNTFSTTFTGALTISLRNNPSASHLKGTLTALAVSGEAIFSDLLIDTPGNGYSLDISGVGLRDAISEKFDITSLHLSFSTQPTGGLTNAPWPQQPAVAILDAFGNTISSGPDSTQTVSLTLTYGTGLLSTTVAVSAMGGVAHFSSLTVDLPGVKQITASASLSTGPETAASSKFGMTVLPPGLLSTTDRGNAAAFILNSAVRVDSADNLYVSGTVSAGGLDGNPLRGVQDYFITKYNSAGVLLWTIEDGAPAATVFVHKSVVVDALGNSYITGITNRALDGQGLHSPTDFFITKYSSAGVRVWTIEDGNDSQAISISLDKLSSSIYVTGITVGSLDGQSVKGQTDFFITKYTLAGIRMWTVEDGAPGGTTFGGDSVVDSLGNVIITGAVTGSLDGKSFNGASNPGGSDDFFVTKYDTTGARQWTLQDGSPGVSAFGSSIGVDSSNNIFVSGVVKGGPIDGQNFGGISPNSQDFFISKYDSSGNRAWTVEDGGLGIGASSFEVTSTSLAVDGAGNILLAVDTANAVDGLSQKGTNDYLYTKYSGSGIRQWTVQGGAPNAAVANLGIASNSAGNFYVVGTTTASINGQPLIGSKDYFLLKF